MHLETTSVYAIIQVQELLSYRIKKRGAIMKPVILAEKPSQAKAYADAFKVKRHEGYLEINA